MRRVLKIKRVEIMAGKNILNREGWREAWVDDNRILGWGMQ